MSDLRDRIEHAIAKASSMAEAAVLTGMPFETFRYHAKKLGVYKPNQSGRGNKYPNRGNSCRYHLHDILANKVLYRAPANLLKKRLIAEGLKQDVCEMCGLGDEWNGKPITLHLDHIDGNHQNNSLENLRVLCPNCHTQTPTYGGKKRV